MHLLLQGELLKPEITFDVILPKDKNYNVSDACRKYCSNKINPDAPGAFRNEQTGFCFAYY